MFFKHVATENKKVGFLSIPRYCVRMSISSSVSCSPNIAVELVILSLQKKGQKIIIIVLYHSANSGQGNIERFSIESRK